MNSFELDFHTKMFFGPGVEKQIGDVLVGDGISRVMVHYDKTAAEIGLLDRICKPIRDKDIKMILLGGVRPNPDIAVVRKGIEECRVNNIQCVIAVGGGSTIDSSKAIVVGTGNSDTDVWDYYDGLVPAPAKALKLVTVPTTAATGSETNASSVLSNGPLKRSFYCDASRARFAFMNPELLYTLPKTQRRCTVADIFVHTHERYCAHHGENRIADACSEGNMRVLLECGEKFVDQSMDYQAASEVMFAGSFAYMTCGLGGPFDWSTHNLAHEVSGHLSELTHAMTVTAMWGSWAKYVVKDNTPRFAQFARNVHGVQSNDEMEAALLGIDKTIAFFNETLKLPTSLTELSGRPFSKEEINSFADSCIFSGRRPTIGKLKELDRNDIVNIYNMANGT